MAKDDKAPRTELERPTIAYEPPAILESAKFETLVGACGYGPGDGTVACRLDNTQAGGGGRGRN